MSGTTLQDAHAVQLPISPALELSGWDADFVARGGRSILLSSSAEEYAARRIGATRRAVETPERIRAYVAALREHAQSDLLVAVDAEPTGVQRLEHLLPELPDRDHIESLTDEQLQYVFGDYARVARQLGVSLFLGPVVDHITGRNTWLAGRTMGRNLESIARIGVAYTRAVQREGVLATAKHFPGHSDLEANPVLEDVSLHLSRAEVERNLLPFARMVSAGVAAVMVGPVTVRAVDPDAPAATSATLVSLLRDTLGFTGMIISDDLDAASTLRGATLGDTAVRSIAAGVELLLVPGGDAVAEISEALAGAVAEGRLAADVLHSAAEKVRSLRPEPVPAVTNVAHLVTHHPPEEMRHP